MENRILKHNQAINEMIRKKYELDQKINEKLLTDGDVLKFEEIMQFMRRNGLRQIWRRDGIGVNRIYAGEVFDFDDLSFEPTARGSVDSKHLLMLLENIADEEYREHYRHTDDGLFVDKVIVYTLKD